MGIVRGVNTWDMFRPRAVLAILRPRQTKNKFYFRSSGWPFMLPVRRPHSFFLFAFFFCKKILSIFEKQTFLGGKDVKKNPPLYYSPGRYTGNRIIFSLAPLPTTPIHVRFILNGQKIPLQTGEGLVKVGKASLLLFWKLVL